MTSWTEPIPVISDMKGNPGSIVIIDPGFFIFPGSDQKGECHVSTHQIRISSVGTLFFSHLFPGLGAGVVE